MLFFSPLIVIKHMEKNLDITKPHYTEDILPVPWPFITSGFHWARKVSLPIMRGVPWVWKWWSKSRPLLRISAPELTNMIFDVTLRRCSKHMLTSKEPIHWRDPTNSLFLSWRSTRACWISLWLGTGLDV